MRLKVECTERPRVEKRRDSWGTGTRRTPAKNSAEHHALRAQAEVAGHAIDRDAGTEQRSPAPIGASKSLIDQHPRRVATV